MTKPVNTVKASATAAASSPPVDPELAARLRLVLHRLVRRMRSHAAGDLSPSLTSALVSIDLHGPITLGQLAALELVKPPSVTRMVARLEERGLVRRETDPGDRRIARVSLTGEGRRAVRRMRTLKTAYLAERLRRLDAPQSAILGEALPVLELLLGDDS